MNTTLTLTVTGLIGALALISAAYCFWLMTVPLSYDRVYVVVIGFAVPVCVFLIALISSLICVMRLRRSRRAPRSSQITPAG
jgi:membrane protein implicated in regulation of membrane protease activity